MTVRLNPYLNFKGTAREAMTFYQSVLGGELAIDTFTSAGMAAQVQPHEADLVMHAMLETPDGLTLMGSDVPEHMGDFAGGSGFAVSLSGDDDATLRGYWDKLAEGAEIQMPLEKAPWGDHFGMLTDKFGINWMMNIAGTPAA